MPQPQDLQKELIASKGKLNAISSIIRLGHEAFTKIDLISWAEHVVNNSILAISYLRSSLLDFRGKNPKLLAVSGQNNVNADSEFGTEILALAAALGMPDKITILNRNDLENQNVSEAALAAFDYLSENSPAILAIPIRTPSKDNSESSAMLWVVELPQIEQIPLASAMSSLLAQHYGESLFYILNNKTTSASLKAAISRNKWLAPSRIFLYIIIAFILSAIFVRIPQNVSAEFEIVPNTDNIYYAPYDGIIAKCFQKDGDSVGVGLPILAFDTDERKFNLAAALTEYQRVSAQLEITQREAIGDVAKRAQVKLLQLQKNKCAVEINRNNYYLDQSEIKAATPGKLSIGEASKLEGKAVRSGEKLFEVIATDNLVALVQLDERNSSVLNANPAVTLYLYTKPEVAINGEITLVSPKPVLNERKQYCYEIKTKLKNVNTELICGMRGIARITGEKVSLGYYIFRQLVLWWRKI
ncbi:MAG: HlyD family efflux transporter periplasmic adaptor subunit [Victivallaceae bacterium]